MKFPTHGMGGRSPMGLAWLAFLGGLGLAALPAQAQEANENPTAKERFVPREEVSVNLERAITYLVIEQNEDGSWGGHGPGSVLEDGFALSTYESWQLAANALACGTLADLDRRTPEQQVALEKAVRYLCSVELPKRDSDWDIDIVWSAVYGFSTCVEILVGDALPADEFQTILNRRGNEFLAVLLKHQALSGGWAYYDDPPFATTPTWATSFTTAAVLPALVDAKAKLGWQIEDRVIERAVKYVERCALPNGAYAYDLRPNQGVRGIEDINMVEGSLARIQVCNWALYRAGVKRITYERIREGLNEFFRFHKFLDHVRTRPIPHEGFHQNAGYFYFFGHFYAARAIELLPAEERAGWYQKLSPHLMKTQWANGAASDFMRAPYAVVAGTAFLASGLSGDLQSRGVPPQNASKTEGTETPAEDVETAK
ncbi:MAG: hypothetical protein KDB61_05260 [Planctomycetes bacterium]|nr:hypothetical protein [Planctomycetota bacterium]